MAMSNTLFLYMVGAAYATGLGIGILFWYAVILKDKLLRIMSIIRNKLLQLATIRLCMGVATYDDHLKSFGLTIEKLVSPSYTHVYLNISLWYMWADVGIQFDRWCNEFRRI